VKHWPQSLLIDTGGAISTSRDRRSLRWLLVHEAGCAECLRAHDDELRRDLVSDAAEHGVRVPRSLSRFA
jgi:hypothetical protein